MDSYEVLISSIEHVVEEPRYLRTVMLFLKRIQADRSAMCFVCDNKIGPTNKMLGGMIIITPMNPDKNIFASGFCPDCANRPNISDTIIERIRDSYMPDSEWRDIHWQSGRA